MAGGRYLHPCQHRTTVDLVVSDSGEAGEVGGQHLRHRLEDKEQSLAGAPEPDAKPAS